MHLRKAGEGNNLAECGTETTELDEMPFSDMLVLTLMRKSAEAQFCGEFWFVSIDQRYSEL